MTNTELYDKIRPLCTAARDAAKKMTTLSPDERSAALERIADSIAGSRTAITAAADADYEAALLAEVDPQACGGLRLDEERLCALCDWLRFLARFPDSLGTAESYGNFDGILIQKKRVPLGAVAFVYDCRPDITIRASAICIKTSNAAILLPGEHSAVADGVIMKLIRSSLESLRLPTEVVTHIDAAGAEAAFLLAGMRGAIDMFIPYINKSALSSAAAAAGIPTATVSRGRGHLYVDNPADIDLAVRATVNAKCSNPYDGGIAGTLIVHKDAAAAYLGTLSLAAAKFGLEYRGDPHAREYLPEAIPAAREDWSAEYADGIIAVKVVDSIDEAIKHINTYGGGSEVIISSSSESIARFESEINCAALFINSPADKPALPQDGDILTDYNDSHAAGTAITQQFARLPALSLLTADRYLIKYSEV